RSMGRGATGVRGMRLIKTFGGAEDDGADTDVAEADDEAVDSAGDGANIIALIIAGEGAATGEILTVSELGYGKRTPVDQFPRRGGGGQGVIAQALADKTGRLIGAVAVAERDEVMLISEAGIMIRFKTSGVRSMGRNTQGVRLMRPDEGDCLVGIDSIDGE